MTTPDLFSFFESAHERRSSVEPGVLPTYAPVTAGAASPADLLVDLNEPQREAVLHAGSPVLVVAGGRLGKDESSHATHRSPGGGPRRSSWVDFGDHLHQ